jgi:hypothetical protein
MVNNYLVSQTLERREINHCLGLFLTPIRVQVLEHKYPGYESRTEKCQIDKGLIIN